jgi:hypothetical protein
MRLRGRKASDYEGGRQDIRVYAVRDNRLRSNRDRLSAACRQQDGMGAGVSGATVQRVSVTLLKKTHPRHENGRCLGPNRFVCLTDVPFNSASPRAGLFHYGHSPSQRPHRADDPRQHCVRTACDRCSSRAGTATTGQCWGPTTGRMTSPVPTFRTANGVHEVRHDRRRRAAELERALVVRCNAGQVKNSPAARLPGA